MNVIIPQTIFVVDGNGFFVDIVDDYAILFHYGFCNCIVFGYILSKSSGFINRNIGGCYKYQFCRIMGFKDSQQLFQILSISL